MQAAGVHPNFADMMFPMEPNFTNPPDGPEDETVTAESWKPPTAM